MGASEHHGRKGKTQKHTAKEIAAKHAAAANAKGAAGGGGAGAAKRAEAKGKGSIKCKIRMAEQPNIISMEKHYDSKHSKIKWDAALKAEYETIWLPAIDSFI